jgi:hypothetical protein
MEQSRTGTSNPYEGVAEKVFGDIGHMIHMIELEESQL